MFCGALVTLISEEESKLDMRIPVINYLAMIIR